VVALKLRDCLLPASLVLARLCVGGIFLIAAVGKVQSPGAFADAIRAFHLLPPALVLPTAYALPWIELLVALYVLTGFLARPAALAAGGLLLVFTAALLDSLMTGNTNHACGCFGPGAGAYPILALVSGGSTVTRWDVVRDLILAGMAALIAAGGAGTLSVDRIRQPRHSRAEAYKARRRAHS